MLINATPDSHDIRMSQTSAQLVLGFMAPLDVARELSEILTSAFGKGWGWAAVYLVARAFKKKRQNWNVRILAATCR